MRVVRNAEPTKLWRRGHKERDFIALSIESNQIHVHRLERRELKNRVRFFQHRARVHSFHNEKDERLLFGADGHSKGSFAKRSLPNHAHSLLSVSHERRSCLYRRSIELLKHPNARERGDDDRGVSVGKRNRCREALLRKGVQLDRCRRDDHGRAAICHAVQTGCRIEHQSRVNLRRLIEIGQKDEAGFGTGESPWGCNRSARWCLRKV
mmetsp:Transcript_30352/g.98676  ORF Transcript_30352/g.98676 Transcript_30352/m.98676 type:complete len:209 (-) Transcript_30352:1410-2036(-)